MPAVPLGRLRNRIIGNNFKGRLPPRAPLAAAACKKQRKLIPLLGSAAPLKYLKPSARSSSQVDSVIRWKYTSFAPWSWSITNFRSYLFPSKCKGSFIGTRAGRRYWWRCPEMCCLCPFRFQKFLFSLRPCTRTHRSPLVEHFNLAIRFWIVYAGAIFHSRQAHDTKGFNVVHRISVWLWVYWSFNKNAWCGNVVN